MKKIKLGFRRINFWFEIVIFLFGLILSILCIYDSASIMNIKYEIIHNADVWGNVIYPQIAANSYLGTFCEKNYSYIFLVGITVTITLIPIQSCNFDILYCDNTKK